MISVAFDRAEESETAATAVRAYEVESVGEDEFPTLVVNVPLDGVPQRDFFGAGYVHNEVLPDLRQRWPVSRGMPLPAGLVRDVEVLSLTDATGNLVPRQVRPLARWPDGSVMFAHVAWQCDVANREPASFKVGLQGGVPSPTKVTVSESADGILVDAGPLQAVVGSSGGVPSLKVVLEGRHVIDGPLDLWTVDAAGIRHTGVIIGESSIRIIEDGPLVAIIDIEGQHKAVDGGVFLDFAVRLRFDAGRPELQLSHTFINLGEEPDGVEVGAIGVTLQRAGIGPESSQIVRQTAAGVDSFTRFAEFPERADIDIESAGIRIADRAVLREDTTDYPPYVMRYLDHVDHWVGHRTAHATNLTFIEEAQQNWPKRIVSGAESIEYHLWPTGAEVQRLRQGMARTQRIRLAWFPPQVEPGVLQCYVYQTSAPATVVVPFEWYQRCEVFGMQWVMPWMPRRYPLLEGRFMAMMERGWVSGMMNYGDDPDSGYGASYGALGITTDTVWINNEHDYMAQAVTQFWRSGRPGAWKSARVCAEHQLDVDFVRKSGDRWKQGGIPAHSHLHTTASAYPSHLWTEGLLRYYVTCGDDRALEVAISIGRLICQYVEERYHVLQTESRMEGWALIALTGLIEITHDERCLQAARTIEAHIREVVERTGTYDAHGLNYGAGTVLTGLAQLHRLTGEDSSLNLMLAILDWHLEHGINDVGYAWCDQYTPYELNLTLPAYAYAWHATGEPRYRDAGLEFFKFTGPPGRRSDVRTAGKLYRTYMPFLQIAHDAGVLQEIERLTR